MKPGPECDLTEKMVMLARSDEAKKLRPLVTQALDAGDDRTIDRALWVLETDGSQDALLLMQDVVHNSTRTIEVRSRPRNNRGARVGDAFLFLIPMLIGTSEKGGPVPCELPPAFRTAAVRSLWQYRLIENRASTALLPGIYAITDLPGTNAQWRALLKIAVAHEHTATPRGLCEKNEADHLRFMVGFTVAWVGAKKSGPLEDGRLEDGIDLTGELAECVEPWRENCALLLTKHLSIERAEIGWPGDIDLAVTEGMQGERARCNQIEDADRIDDEVSVSMH